MPVKTLSPKAAGFTLLEVLLAIVLLTTAILSLFEAFSGGLFLGSRNESDLVALNLAREKMESIRNTAYAGVVDETKAVVTGFPAYEREVVVTTPQTDLKQVAVNVTWEDKSTELSTSLVTYVSNV
ncbi:MAG: prepilin-type N-terminal cleavage/methylation domain-containing protein [Candidatus Omnitrophica bacterium]|nr:prepilin-type N-terminal cleavage/methylation domain-containing protein [Candidatus Omnitrophota bacterium]